jgi:RAMA domain-containing protein/uncharacterized protein DUF5655
MNSSRGNSWDFEVVGERQSMDRARDNIRATLNQVKAFLAQESPPKITEADTKANFIEPIVAALGWTGIGVVTREYYVKNSQEFIDYVMRGPNGPLLAIESKALQSDLTEKAAAQLIQYCAVEGIEWAALTNGRELQFFNSFLKPDLSAKRILSLDLLAYNNEDEFDALFQQLWQLSRESMTTPTGVRSWLNQRRMDATLRSVLLDPSSAVTRQLRKALSDADIRATHQDVAQWFRSHLGSPVTVIPNVGARTSGEVGEATTRGGTLTPKPTEDGLELGTSEVFRGEHGRLLPLFNALRIAVDGRIGNVNWRAVKYYLAAEQNGKTFLAVKRRAQSLVIGFCLPPEMSAPRLLSDTSDVFRWSRITKMLFLKSVDEIDDLLLLLVEQSAKHAETALKGKLYHGISLKDLLNTGYLRSGETLYLSTGRRIVATAFLTATGGIEWEGKVYSSPSDRTFAALLGRSSLNGWTAWNVERGDGRQSLAALRTSFQQQAGK